MDGFSYHNIFETKGIEYLIIIAFLLLIVPFWFFINRKVSIRSQFKGAAGSFTTGILSIPLGLLFSKNHTWAHLEKSGIAEVGIDYFTTHVAGAVKLCNLRDNGSFIKRGDHIADIGQSGKLLHIYSPISGKVTDTNSLLFEMPQMINEDPYDKGWIYKISPSNWVEETSKYYLADEALAWSKMELQRFKDFLAVSLSSQSPGVSMAILQDGGELCDMPLSGLPEKTWEEFQESFLNLSD
jgi:glycine cleavage system H protein